MQLTAHQRRVCGWALGRDPQGEDDQWIMGWFGGQRSGKTTGSAMAMSLFGMRLLEGHAGVPLILGGRRIRSIETNVLPPLREVAETLGLRYRYYRGDGVVRTGPVDWWMYGGGREDSQAALQGITAAGALIDELPKLARTFWDEVVARCSIPEARIIATGNPEGPSHWCKTELIDGGRCAYQLSNPVDNSHLDAAVVLRYREQYSGHMAARRVEGQWAAASGLVYPRWEYAPVDLIPSGEFEVACDWGTATVTAALLIGSLGDRWVVWDEYYHDARRDGSDERSPTEHAAGVTAMAAGRTGTIVLDPSAAALRLALRDAGWRVRRGNNDVLMGIDVTNDALMSARVLVHPRCVNLIRELNTHRWDETALEDGVDRPVKRDDHGPDALRYWCMSRFGR